MNWQGVKEYYQEQKERALEGMGEGLWRFAPLLLALYLLAALVMGFFWSSEPEGLPSQRAANAVVGTATTESLIRVADTLLSKPGGFISNDILPPGVWLDNIPNWEYGVLIQVRDLAKAMRESFSRSQTPVKY